MADAGYTFAPIFLIRLAGVPFDELSALATVESAKVVRDLITRERECEEARSKVEQLLLSRQHGLSKEQYRAWRRAVRTNEVPLVPDPSTTPFLGFCQSAGLLLESQKDFEIALQRELSHARVALQHSAVKFLPDYLVFAANSVVQILQELIELRKRPNDQLPPRKKNLRARERHLLLYLQRVCGKNDTLSAFGPGGWGSVQKTILGVSLDPQPGIAQRETFLERWTAHGIAAAINADPETRPEIAPRLHPHGRIKNGRYVFTDTGDTISLAPETQVILQACHGITPAHSLGVDMEILGALAAQKFIRWELEVPALEPYAFNVLLADVSRWRDTAVRARWLERLQPIAALPARFAATTDTGERIALIGEAAHRLEELGAQKTSSRFLYSATNPIGEECFRDCRFTISERLLEEVTVEAASWIDLWRDNYAYVAGRVAASASSLYARNLFMAFREVKAAFTQTFADRADLPEIQVTPHDCEFVRRNFTFDRFDEYTYPSADLQLSASSVDNVAQGDYQWILAELHPPVALLHHGFYWSCPEPDALSVALTRTLSGQPNFQFGYFAADFTATTAVRVFSALPQATYFAAPQRAAPEWKIIPPAEAEVFLHEQNGDVGLRRRDTHEYLGSFARAWVIPLGFHPFSFSLGKHTPRLLCGKVVVQRRSWTIALEELSPGDFTGVSRHLVIAVEKLRAARDLPRHIYIRPTEQALRRTGAEGRDKDTKPVYVDLESYLFLEIFHRWLVKAGELEVTEMLPDPEHLLWQEKDGRRTFELRTQIVPR